MITFAVGDLRDPTRELPLAMYLALGVTAATYILISLGVFGTLTVDEVVAYGETAIAEAARPALGDAGFTMMAIAALLATSSSVNATLYASGALPRCWRRSGQFPPFFGRDSTLGAHAGVLVTAALDARRRQPRRPLGDRVRRQRHLAPHLPPRRRCGVQAPSGDRRAHGDRHRRDRS